MLTEKDKKEVCLLVDVLNTIKQQNNNNKVCLKVCGDALNVASAILNNKTTKNYLLKITQHCGKMQGINSLSTYKLVCETCLSLKNDAKTICHRCYADRQLSIYKQLAPSLIYNTLLLKYTKLHTRQLPVINASYFRFEAFSDLQNARHLQNLYAIAKHNPQTHFALWSKNLKLLLQYKAPKNINIILSNYFLNSCIFDEYTAAKIKQLAGAKHVKIFTVYDKKHITSVSQNCEKKCITCLKCYKKSDPIMFVNELLK